jgi:hypothetical protein
MNAWELTIVSTLCYGAGVVTIRFLASKEKHICAACFIRKAANEFHKPLFEVFRWPPTGPAGLKLFCGINWGVTIREGGKVLYARIKKEIMSGPRLR